MRLRRELIVGTSGYGAIARSLYPLKSAKKQRERLDISTLISAQSKAPGSQAALAELCKIDWYPIYAFVRRRGHDVDEAQDLTQGFFLHLLDHKAVHSTSICAAP